MLIVAIASMELTSVAGAAPSTAEAPISCDVAPRSVADIVALLSEPTSDGSPQLSEPLHFGSSPDAVTAEAITDVVRQLEACLNSGDQLRLYALYSDGTFQRIPRTDEILVELKALETATPMPVPAGERLFLIGPWHMRLLDDGRVVAAVGFSSESEVETSRRSATKALFFIREGNRWLIDDTAGFIWVEGNEGPIDVEDIVGPPPRT